MRGVVFPQVITGELVSVAALRSKRNITLNVLSHFSGVWSYFFFGGGLIPHNPNEALLIKTFYDPWRWLFALIRVDGRVALNFWSKSQHPLFPSFVL